MFNKQLTFEIFDESQIMKKDLKQLKKNILTNQINDIDLSEWKKYN